jgi:hypothetical protein
MAHNCYTPAFVPEIMKGHRRRHEGCRSGVPGAWRQHDLYGEEYSEIPLLYGDMPASSYESRYLSPMAHNCYTPAFVPEIMKGTVGHEGCRSGVPGAWRQHDLYGEEYSEIPLLYGELAAYTKMAFGNATVPFIISGTKAGVTLHLWS